MSNTRNHITAFGYRTVVKPLLFRLDPETVHDRFTAIGEWLGEHRAARAVTRWLFNFTHPALEQTLAGIHFVNPIGLSAGFDKDGRLTSIMPAVGFGFMEVGSVTGQPCPGNPKPRLWRLPKSKSLAVYYGLKSEGSAAVAARLKNRPRMFPFGISVAKANLAETDTTEAGIADYLRAIRELAALGDYLTINISCPNTSGGEPFCQPDNLDQLLTSVDALGLATPVFIKLPVDMNNSAIDQLLAAAERHRIAGFICTNLTKDRANPAIVDAFVPPRGGLSGKVLEARSNELLRHVRQQVGSRFVLIGSGGVFTAEDAYKKIRLGASLVQLITGMIYRGPHVISEMTMGLVKLLQRDGFSSIAEAVGTDVD